VSDGQQSERDCRQFRTSQVTPILSSGGSYGACVLPCTKSASHRVCILLALSLALVSACGWSQTQLGTVSGTITDATGAESIQFVYRERGVPGRASRRSCGQSACCNRDKADVPTIDNTTSTVSGVISGTKPNRASLERPRRPPQVMADRVRLQRALMDLILIGIGRCGTRLGELGSKSQLAEDGQLLISVTDIGM
jgi:hypothetical protein